MVLQPDRLLQPRDPGHRRGLFPAGAAPDLQSGAGDSMAGHARGDSVRQRTANTSAESYRLGLQNTRSRSNRSPTNRSGTQTCHALADRSVTSRVQTTQHRSLDHGTAARPRSSACKQSPPIIIRLELKTFRTSHREDTQSGTSAY